MEVIRKKVNSLKNQLEETEQRAGTAEEELKKEQDRNAKVQVGILNFSLIKSSCVSQKKLSLSLEMQNVFFYLNAY